MNYIVKIITIIFSLMLIAVIAHADEWKRATVYPGSKKILQMEKNFPECWERNMYNYNEWLNCKYNKNHISWDQLLNKVRKTAEFTLNNPGYITYRFETYVPEKVFYHQEPSFWVLHMDTDGKWKQVGTGQNVYMQLYHGSKLRSGSSGKKFAYKINPDGSLKYYVKPPLYKAGKYKVIIEAGKRTGAYDLAYVPGNTSLAVYFIARDATVNKITHNEPAHISDSDGDGVPDDIDMCPNTKAGISVNTDGCPKGEIKGIIDNSNGINEQPITGMPGKDEIGEGPNWKLDQRKAFAIKITIEYMRKRAKELAATDKNISDLLNLYADRIFLAKISYQVKPPRFNPNGEASCNWFGEITIYGNINGYEPFSFGKHPLASYDESQLGIVASLLMHEVAHSYGADEWQAHHLQSLTFDALKVNNQASVRYVVNSYCKKFPKRDKLYHPLDYIRSQYYWILP